MTDLLEISSILKDLKTKENICEFLTDLLTENEISTLSKLWRILKLLAKGETQRKIATDLNVGLCKVTRGAKILKNKKSVITKKLIKENNNVTNK